MDSERETAVSRSLIHFSKEMATVFSTTAFKEVFMRTFIVCLLITHALVATGCKDNNPLGAIMVTGTVTLDGEPVPFANVAFHPQSDDIPFTSGMTDAKGNFRLTPIRGVGGEGALPGTYRVSLTKSGLSEQELYGIGGKQFPDTDALKVAVDPATGIAPPVKRPDFFPVKYTSPDTSELEVSVVKGDRNHFEFKCIRDK